MRKLFRGECAHILMREKHNANEYLSNLNKQCQKLTIKQEIISVKTFVAAVRFLVVALSKRRLTTCCHFPHFVQMSASPVVSFVNLPLNVTFWFLAGKRAHSDLSLLCYLIHRPTSCAVKQHLFMEKKVFMFGERFKLCAVRMYSYFLLLLSWLIFRPTAWCVWKL